MWVLIVRDQNAHREQVCESRGAAETRRCELMKNGIFATVEFRRQHTHAFDSGRAMKRQPRSSSVTPERLQVPAGRFRKP